MIEIRDDNKDIFKTLVIEKLQIEAKWEKERLIWFLKDPKTGEKYYRRVFLVEKAKPIILEDFRKIKVPLVEGLEQGMKDAEGKPVRVKIPADGKDLQFCYQTGRGGDRENEN